MCFNCITTFLGNPIKLTIVVISFIFAIVLLVMFIKKRAESSNLKKIGIIYGSLLFFIFPFIFFLYGRTCQKTFISCNIYKSILYSLPMAVGVALLTGFLIAPFVYGLTAWSRISKNTHLGKFVEKHSKKANIKTPKVYVVDSARPMAFSFSYISPKIFLTVGLTELLKRKEVEAVLLHELGHVKLKTSLVKFTNTIFRFFSPISNFNLLYEELSSEEIKADKFAISIQKTSRYILEAKQKISDYNKIKEVY